MKIGQTYVWPNNIRENQHNCAFYLHSTEDGKQVRQFDIKGEKDRVYNMTINQFNDNWQILSYVFFSRFISKSSFEYPLLYNGKPFSIIKTK